MTKHWIALAIIAANLWAYYATGWSISLFIAGIMTGCTIQEWLDGKLIKLWKDIVEEQRQFIDELIARRGR